MAKVTINGTTFTVPDGSSVVVSGDTIRVGESLSISGLKNQVKVVWQGPVGDLACEHCEIAGDVTGNVKCAQIKCGTVGGSIEAVQVNCGSVFGSVSATQVSRK